MAIQLWRVLFATALVAAVRVDDMEDPGPAVQSPEADAGASPSQAADDASLQAAAEKAAGGDAETAAEKSNACDKKEDTQWHPLQDPQDAARAAAVGAHAAGKSPHDVVVAAGKAASRACNTDDPKRVAYEVALATERAMGFPQEQGEVTAEAVSVADARKGRTVEELAAADTAKAAQDAAEARGEGFQAVVAAHARAAITEAEHGSGQGYMWAHDPEAEVSTTNAPETAQAIGLYAMWKAYRGGASRGEVVNAAVEAATQAGALSHEIDTVTQIASAPETFEMEGKFSDAKAVALKAAIKADNAGWPLPHVAVAAARAAATETANTPGQGPAEAILAARTAAEMVMDKDHISVAEHAARAAEKAKKKAETDGLSRPPATIADLTAKAAASAAERRGAPPAYAAKLAQDARDTVDLSNVGTLQYDNEAWDNRVYKESDIKNEQRTALKGALGGAYTETEAKGSVEGEADEVMEAQEQKQLAQ